MTPFLPGIPAPSDHLAKAARILSEIEWRERFGFDIADLEAEFAAHLARYTLEVVWARVTALPREALV